MKITCETKDTLELSELTDFQGELKHRTKEDVQKIITSIEKFGFATPFFVWSHDGINHVLDGHGRLLALRKMKNQGEDIPPLPIVYVDCEDEEHARKLLLRITSQYGEMTSESVLEFMEGLELEVDEISLPEGVLNIDFPHDEEDTSADDEVPEVQDEAISQLGEMYELGDSILMCGDFTSEEDVARLMNGEVADLVLTDPPYGIDVVQGNSVGGLEPPTFEKKGTVGGGKICKVHQYAKIIGDESTDTAKINYEIIKNYSNNQILFGGNYFTDFLFPSKCWVVWDKENTGNFADCELAWTSFDKGAKLYKWLWNGMSRKGNRTDEGKVRVHPTQKPVGMLMKILEDFSAEKEIILDCFGGSGSTLIACERTNRRCRMIEMSPEYCDVIRRRYTQWAKENNKPLTSGCLE